MTSVLISMCQSNTLGPAEMVLLAGFRDEQDNMKCFQYVFLLRSIKQYIDAIVQISLHGHHDSSNSDTFPLDRQEVVKILKAWSDHCEERIPSWCYFFRFGRPSLTNMSRTC